MRSLAASGPWHAPQLHTEGYQLLRACCWGLQVVLISRQTSGVSSKKRVARRMANEKELLAMLLAIPGCRAQLVDLATLSLPQQMELMAGTDILVGGHWLLAPVMQWATPGLTPRAGLLATVA